MKPYPAPYGLSNGLEVLIDKNWTPEQACAVFELLDDLRERIWEHYQPVLSEYYANERIYRTEPPLHDPPSGEPF